VRTRMPGGVGGDRPVILVAPIPIIRFRKYIFVFEFGFRVV